MKGAGNVPKIAMPMPHLAEGNKQMPGMQAVNDEIEDIDSDDEYAMAAH